MIPIYAVTCEKVEKRQDGLTNLIGVHFVRSADSFPAKLSFVIAFEWRIGDADRAGENEVVVGIHHDDEDLTEMTAIRSNKFRFPKGTKPGQLATFYKDAISITVNFPAAGDYVFDLRHNGVSWSRLRYRVFQKGQPYDLQPSVPST